MGVGQEGELISAVPKARNLKSAREPQVRGMGVEVPSLWKLNWEAERRRVPCGKALEGLGSSPKVIKPSAEIWG